MHILAEERTAYRVPSGLSMRGVTCADVIRHEQEELGNNLGVDAETIAELEGVPAHRHILWVCFTLRHAMRYGRRRDVEDFVLPVGARILAEDGDDGYLVHIP